MPFTGLLSVTVGHLRIRFHGEGHSSIADRRLHMFFLINNKNITDVSKQDIFMVYLFYCSILQNLPFVWNTYYLGIYFGFVFLINNLVFTQTENLLKHLSFRLVIILSNFYYRHLVIFSLFQQTEILLRQKWLFLNKFH